MAVLKNHFIKILTVCILTVTLIIAFNKMTIQVDSVEKLNGLMRMDFSDVEITDIQYKYIPSELYTRIFIFLNEPGELKSNAIVTERAYDPNLEYISPGHIAELKEMGIEFDQIQNHGWHYNEISVGRWIAPYEIHWYQIDQSYDGVSNIVVLVGIPRKIAINVDNIIQEKE